MDTTLIGISEAKGKLSELVRESDDRDVLLNTRAQGAPMGGARRRVHRTGRARCRVRRPGVGELRGDTMRTSPRFKVTTGGTVITRHRPVVTACHALGSGIERIDSALDRLPARRRGRVAAARGVGLPVEPVPAVGAADRRGAGVGRPGADSQAAPPPGP